MILIITYFHNWFQCSPHHRNIDSSTRSHYRFLHYYRGCSSCMEFHLETKDANVMRTASGKGIKMSRLQPTERHSGEHFTKQKSFVLVIKIYCGICLTLFLQIFISNPNYRYLFPTLISGFLSTDLLLIPSQNVPM